MVSEIKGPGPHSGQRVEGGARHGTAQRSAALGAGSAPRESVTLTDLAARLKQLGDAVKDLPVVDQARVEAFRNALASGEYRMDERQIADKLAAFEALVGHGRRA